MFISSRYVYIKRHQHEFSRCKLRLSYRICSEVLFGHSSFLWPHTLGSLLDWEDSAPGLQFGEICPREHAPTYEESRALHKINYFGNLPFCRYLNRGLSQWLLKPLASAVAAWDLFCKILPSLSVIIICSDKGRSVLIPYNIYVVPDSLKTFYVH